MDKLAKSEFLRVTHGSGYCDCCDQARDQLVMLTISSECIGLCLGCLPEVVRAMEDKGRELRDKQ